jgi:inorganic pyrophosphatase
MNPWHDVSIGDNAPDSLNCIIEIPIGSKAKYELDKKTGLLKLDRVLYSSVIYPANYGFIPQTYCEDHDPLDILVLCSITVVPLCIMTANVIGVMRMVDQGEADDKIIAVASHDMSYNHITDINQLPPHTTKEIKRFFEDYKALENKEVLVEDFMGKKEAMVIVQDAMKMYQANKRFLIEMNESVII